MPHVLLVERSDTLRHVLTRLLENAGFETDATANYLEAHDRLVSLSPDHTPYDIVLLGWPKHGEPNAERLLDRLLRDPYRQTGVAVLAQEVEPAIQGWCTQQGNATPVLWENYRQVLSVLASIVDRSRSQSISPPAADLQIPIRILLVDDSPTVRRHFGGLLSDHGYYTETAYSVEEGLRLALTKPFDIAIIDYFMPDQNGDVLCRKLRSNPHTTHIACAILTATYVEQVIHDALEAGSVECIFKDESEELFMARVSAISRLIRARKSAEAERKRLAGILGSVGDGVYGVDRSGRITFINPAARRILGYVDSPTQLEGQLAHVLFHFAHEDGTARVTEHCFLCRAYGTGNELHCWETVFWNRSGKPLPVECTIFPLRIQGRLEGSVVAFRDISERKGIEELRWQANHDPLTELYNNRYFIEQVEDELAQLRRGSDRSALLIIDLDRFKFVNDLSGHTVGDHLLVEVARILRTRLRESDILARIGGDEFGILLRNIDPRNLYYIANSFRDVLSESSFSYGGRSLRIYGSVGAALLNKSVQSAEEAFKSAELACQMAKRRGRNQTYVMQEPEDPPGVAADPIESSWSERLREALSGDGFQLYYQPILAMADIACDPLPGEGVIWNADCLKSEREQIFEVLVRLTGPNGEITPPHAFLPSAERFDLLKDIDLWVVSRALKVLSKIRRRYANVAFSINLSSRTLEDPTLLEMIRNLLAATDLALDAVIFEVTETSAITNLAAAQRFMGELRQSGCRFALDDFGSGFSSFTYLKHLPVDFIKIDGQFVQDMVIDSVDSTMVTHMNEIAHTLGRKTIAEYVENPQVLHMLRQCGVDWVQGNYISQPLPDLELLVEAHNPLQPQKQLS
ncbi:MAG: EAL domain-containing protein [Proteobacteria bacterium]|nr:MAG: EAL domain-containing protein [Pseudomonadota bacterium]QKK12542.1 MAG: EAL domain-containing protein [Pseudomonadota bacterium]